MSTRASAFAVGFCLPLVGGLFVALRFYTRWHNKIERRIDDWLCLPAWLCLTGCCTSLLIGVFEDVLTGQPVTDLDNVAQQQRMLAQLTAAFFILWMFANTLIKLSILLFYRRVFIGRTFNICTWIMITLSIIWLGYTFVSWILYCGTDLSANFEGGWAACPSWGFQLQLGIFPFNNLIDLALIVLPFPFVWTLHLSLSRKVVIVVIFLLGGLAFVAGIVNTVVQFVYYTRPDLVAHAKFFQGFSVFFIWPSVEIGVGLIACNLPSLSFRAVHSLIEQIRRGWDLSWSRIRHMTAMLSLQRQSDQDSGNSIFPGVKNPIVALERFDSSAELDRSEQRSLAASDPEVPLVVQRGKGNRGS